MDGTAKQQPAAEEPAEAASASPIGAAVDVNLDEQDAMDGAIAARLQVRHEQLPPVRDSPLR